MNEIEALITFHSKGDFTVPPSMEVASFAMLADRRSAAQVRFDTVGLPRDTTHLVRPLGAL